MNSSAARAVDEGFSLQIETLTPVERPSLQHEIPITTRRRSLQLDTAHIGRSLGQNETRANIRRLSVQLEALPHHEIQASARRLSVQHEIPNLGSRRPSVQLEMPTLQETSQKEQVEEVGMHRTDSQRLGTNH